LDGDSIFSELADSSGVGDGVVRQEVARVVVAARSGAGKAVPAARGSGEGALSGATACRAVSGGDVVGVAIDPEELASNVKHKV